MVISCSECEAAPKSVKCAELFVSGGRHPPSILALLEKRPLQKAAATKCWWVAYVPGGGVPVQTC